MFWNRHTDFKTPCLCIPSAHMRNLILPFQHGSQEVECTLEPSCCVPEVLKLNMLLSGTLTTAVALFSHAKCTIDYVIRLAFWTIKFWDSFISISFLSAAGNAWKRNCEFARRGRRERNVGERHIQRELPT